MFAPPRIQTDLTSVDHTIEHEAVHYNDLGATVHRGGVPAGLLAELPDLYGSLFSIDEWFSLMDDVTPTTVCILEKPRHVLACSVDGDTVEVLNKVIDIGSDEATRCCRALFRAFPRVRRIHLEVKFTPRDLPMPKRVLRWTDDMVLNLPPSIDQYLASLGRSTRHHLRQYGNKFGRECPDRSTCVIPGADAPRELVDLLVAWKVERFRAKGRVTGWEMDGTQVDRLYALVQSCGEAHLTTVNGQKAALIFAFTVGDTVCPLEAAFDPRYERFHLGLLSLYWVACYSIGRRAKRLELLWGTTTYKSRLGARPERAYRLSVFRHHTSRLMSPLEALSVMRMRLGGLKTNYWKLRRAASNILR